MNPDNPSSRREPGPVTRIFNLLYRRFAFGAPHTASPLPAVPQFNYGAPGSSINLFIAAFSCLAFTSAAAIPAPEQILPDDTLLLLTAPDYGKLHEIWQRSPKSRFWNDPAMKPLQDKFLSRWREEVVKPLAQDLSLHLDTFASLPQGQLTFAVTRNAWQGSDDQPLGFLLLLDARDKTDLLRTNLADLRKKWVSTGKTLKTEKIRNLEFAIFPFTTNDVPKTLSKFLWRPPVFP